MPDIVPHPDAEGAWLAPAKLNLMLRVLGRRADGYHSLQTVFQFLAQADRLYFSPRSDGRILRRRGCAEIAPEQDLVVRAAMALRAATGCTAGVEIAVDKVLPMGGGLGGGSSDAATALHALNQLWDLGLSSERLADIGLVLGADVPVFVRGQACWAEGVGEQMTPVTLPEPWYVVLTPSQRVSTAAIFNDPELTRDSSALTMADFVAGQRPNDCLAVVRKHYQSVAAAYDWLEAMDTAPQLTGTGGCVFAPFTSAEQARAVAACAPSEYEVFVSRGCNRSPLFD
ncbi:4-(cytidine 5'-diphospho)-2-C-methyl-D-erythritol kinase [uncultured Thiohalocapsa sp.]|uniref:4-(cytidine 5'-diphospho)-2-C-methyl-D-erythritol kinase n=1 Tax=uncultured Thiohalocapsa sp. TaxID=768990 RepID=UPI0025E90007|nr:4-(cytidine 5'-diphospho)-2-C-methyl-D-erythritol kinase [uncultured Thiohalocapsa sp.]